jgi:hypothetical protein
MPKKKTAQQIRRKRVKELKQILTKLENAINDPAMPPIRLASLAKSYAMNLTQLHRLEKQQQQEAEQNSREPRKPGRPRKIKNEPEGHQHESGGEQPSHNDRAITSEQVQSGSTHDVPDDQTTRRKRVCYALIDGCTDPECENCRHTKQWAKRRRSEFDSAKSDAVKKESFTRPASATPADTAHVQISATSVSTVENCSGSSAVTEFRPKIVREPRFFRAEVGTMYLTAADAADILKGNRPASIRELEYVVQNAELLKLSASAKEQLRIFLREKCAERVIGFPVGNENGLTIVETPFGPLLNPDWIEQLRRAALRQIESCPSHQPPRCRCCAEIRERLWNVGKEFGNGSGENWCAQRIWSELEDLEKRPRRRDNIHSNSDLDALAGLNWIGKRKPKA